MPATTRQLASLSVENRQVTAGHSTLVLVRPCGECKPEYWVAERERFGQLRDFTNQKVLSDCKSSQVADMPENTNRAEQSDNGTSVQDLNLVA